MAAPTARDVALDALGFWGITSLDPATGSVRITATDLRNVATAMSQALQEYFRIGPAEIRNLPGSSYLNAPTALTLTATIGSNTISALTTYVAWMLGCTIRISGDDQDNELLSSTLLARPYTGASGSGKTATIYADCVQLDETIGTIRGPMSLPNQPAILPVFTREEFLRTGNYPGFTDASGVAVNTGLPFYFFSQKPISTRPWVWFVDSAYNALLDYVPRKIRFSPMPGGAVSFGYSATLNAPRIATTDIDNGDHTTDPLKKLPIVDGQHESIFIPILRQILTGYPQFKAADTKPEIVRAYKEAVAALKDSHGQRGVQTTVFL